MEGPSFRRMIQVATAAFIALHLSLLAAYTLPDAWVPDGLRFVAVRYVRPLFHQQWQLFAPDPPLCSSEVEVLLSPTDVRPIAAAQHHYLTQRMANTIAWNVQRELGPGTNGISPLMAGAMRAMVRDMGRESASLRFQLREQCVVDAQLPAEREERIIPLELP